MNSSTFLSSHQDRQIVMQTHSISEPLNFGKNKSNSESGTLVVIAPTLKDYHQLVAGVQPGANVIVLDENRDGIEQITAAITHYSASHLHIICHGAPGVLKLGKTALSSANINQYSHLLQEWGVTNILLWSCQVAAKNTNFLTTLHQLTGANIAASANLVGNEESYRNWKLEYYIGNVTEEIPFTPEILENYSGVFVEPNDNFLTAQNIGVLGTTQTFNDSVGTTDRNDYYEFTLNQISEVNLNLTGLQEAAQLSIAADFDNDGILDSGELIENDGVADFSSSTVDRNISKTLAPGTYAIRIYTNDTDDNTSYTLSASATTIPATTAIDPGENFLNALDIGTLGATQTFTDAVGSFDRNDYYEFTLNQISQVTLNLTGLTEAAQLAIAVDFDNDGIFDNGELIENDGVSDASSSTAERGISKTLSPGTYAAIVYTNDSDDNTGYSFSASATPQPPTNATDPGENFNSALNWGRLRGTRTINDAVGSLDRDDYYEFSLSQTSDVTFSLTGLTEAAQLAIVQDLDNDGILGRSETIENDGVSDSSSSTVDRGISTTLSPGTYAVRVFAFGSDDNTGYTLTASGPENTNEVDYTSQRFTVNGVYDPIAGDFNGDGNGDILWYRPGRATDYIWSFNDDNTFDSEPFTVNGDYTPIPGDFDGSGTTDIIWYRPGRGADYLWSFEEDGTFESEPFTINGDYTPVTGDFDGSGTTDVLWYRPGRGADFLWFFDEDGTFDSQAFPVNGTYDPITGDFDGSGTTDILWYSPGRGADFLWSFDEDGTFESERFTVNGVYEPIEGDFNNDNIDDIIWYAPGRRNDFIWTFQADGSFDSTSFNINGVYEPVVEDFDGNGFTDVLWYQAGPGADYLWSFE